MRTLKYGKREYQVDTYGNITRQPFTFEMPNGYIATKKSRELKPYKTKSGYMRVSLQERFIFVHRIVYLAYYGEIPEGLFIDHINGNRLDNRPCNLRLVTKSENAMNRQGPNKNNKCGKRGVYFNKRYGKWAFSVCGKQRLWTSDREKAFSASLAFYGM